MRTERIKDKVIELRSMDQLVATVKNDLSSFNAEGFIDAGRLVKTILYCNEKLGLYIRDIKEAAIPVREFKADLPLDFDKMYYVAALDCTNSGHTTLMNAFDNNVDQDVIYKAELDRESLGCVDNYRVVIERKGTIIPYYYNSWTQLGITKNSFGSCHNECPNKLFMGKYQVQIQDDYISTPFRSGMLYIMYVALLRDEDGNIQFPFHPLITPYYEWALKEKILSDMIFNSDKPNIVEMFKLAQQERAKAWIDAFNFASEPEFGHFKELQRKRELKWYNSYFKWFTNDIKFVRTSMLENGGWFSQSAK